MKTVVYIGVAAVVTGVALVLYLNWSINRMVQEQGQPCPVLLGTPPSGC